MPQGDRPRQRAGAGAGDAAGAAKASDLDLSDVDAAARLDKLAGDVADDGDFEAVEDPYRAETDEDVKPQ